MNKKSIRPIDEMFNCVVESSLKASMNKLPAVALALGLGTSGAVVGYATTPRTTETTEVGRTFELIDSISNTLIKNGVDPSEVAEARQNLDKPIPADWWEIILKFTLMGASLSIDVAALTIFMKSFPNAKEKMAWLTAIPAMHFVLPEMSGLGLSTVFNQSALGFIAAVCFCILIRNMHNEEHEAHKHHPNESTAAKFARYTHNVLGGTMVTTAALSTDSLAAGPAIVEQSHKLGVSPEVANTISAASVFVCTLIAVGLQKHKDQLLKLIAEENAEIYGKALATGAFTWFLLDCLYSGLDATCGIGLSQEQVNSITVGLAAISPVASVIFSQRQAAHKATK